MTVRDNTYQTKVYPTIVISRMLHYSYSESSELRGKNLTLFFLPHNRALVTEQQGSFQRDWSLAD